MRVQPVEAKPELNTEMEKKNMQIVVDSSVLALIFVGFVGVLLGVLVAAMWK